MPERAGRPQGWHLDPHDPTIVRHWDGERWQQVRSRPTWSLATGEIVIDAEGRFGVPGPVVEGPARPATQRATTKALGIGAESRPVTAGPAPLRSPSGPAGARGRHLPPAGLSDDAITQPPWASSRRPLVIFAVIVLAAVTALAASVGWSNVRPPVPDPIPSGFVTQASQACAAGLGPQRPATLPPDAASATAEVSQVANVTAALAQIATSTGARSAVTIWLNSLQQYVTDEQQRATVLAALGASGTPTSSPAATALPPAGANAVMTTPDAASLTRQAQRDADSADHFSGINDLQTCTILARAPASELSIPS